MKGKENKSKLGVFVLYAIGQFGWSLASYGVLNLLPYFYMPPEEAGQAVFPPYIYQGAILGSLTVIGIIAFGGRIFDAFTDPVIANLSDRSTSKLGRRRKFMLLSFLPFTLLSVLVFFPISMEDGSANVIWLSVTVALFYLFMTMYVVPYTALIAELGQTKSERMTISTLISVTWALGFAVGSQAIALQGFFESGGSDSTEALQRTVMIFGGVGGLMMLITSLGLNEKKYTRPLQSSLSLRDSMRIVLGNKNFRAFAASDFFYWLAITFIQVGIAYYVVELLGREKEFTSTFLLLTFALSFLFYFPIMLLARKIGKVKLIRAGFLLFSIAFVLTSLLGTNVLPENLHISLLIGASAVSMAIFGILPNAIVGDLADAHGREIGAPLAGMYFGVRTLIMKAGISFANLIFTSFLLMEGSTGIRLSAGAAVVFCLLGFICFLWYQSPQNE